MLNFGTKNAEVSRVVNVGKNKDEECLTAVRDFLDSKAVNL